MDKRSTRPTFENKTGNAVAIFWFNSAGGRNPKHYATVPNGEHAFLTCSLLCIAEKWTGIFSQDSEALLMVLEPCANRACMTNGSFDCLPQRICYHLKRLEAQYACYFVDT
jgi:hypothetical protein